MAKLSAHFDFNGNYASSRFEYDGSPTDDIDALLARAQEEIQHERDNLHKCPVHNRTRARASSLEPNLDTVPKEQLPPGIERLSGGGLIDRNGF